MALQASPPISLLNVVEELGASPPISLDSPNVRTLAGKPTSNISLLDLLGKASRSYTVQGAFQTEDAGLGQYYSQAVLSIHKTPSEAPTPTAYLWSFNDQGSGIVQLGSATGSTLTLRGPVYDFGAAIQTVTVSCQLVVDGSPVTTPAVVLEYTTDNL